MADPISIASGSLGIASATINVANTIAKLINELKDLKEELELVRTELESIESILFLIADNVHKVIRDGAMVPPSLSSRLEVVLQKCKASVQDTSDLVTKYAAGGFKSRVGWLVTGKDDFLKAKEHLTARRADLDVYLSMLNLTLSSGIRIGTTQMLDGQAAMHDDVQGIMKAIQSLQEDQPKLEELLDLLRSMSGDGGQDHKDNFMMDRFIDSLTTYAETVHERTVVGDYENLPDLADLASLQSLTLGPNSADLDNVAKKEPAAPFPLTTKDHISDADSSQYSATKPPSYSHLGPLQAPTASVSDSGTTITLKFREAARDADLRCITARTNPLAVEHLLRQGADPNRKKFPRGIEHYLTNPNVPRELSSQLPLTNAVIAGNDPVVQLLLDRGADPNAVGDDRLPAIVHAIRNGSVNSISMLVDAGVNINMTWTEEVVTRAEQGVRYRYTKTIPHTPLMLALEAAPRMPLDIIVGMLTVILDAGADPNRCFPESNILPPLSQCITQGPGKEGRQLDPQSAADIEAHMAQVAAVLIRYGANVNLVHSVSHFTAHPILLALHHQRTTILELLLANGSSLRIPTRLSMVRMRPLTSNTGNFAELVRNVVLGDSWNPEHTWLAEMFKNEPQLGIWCLLDTINAISDEKGSPTVSRTDGIKFLVVLVRAGADVHGGAPAQYNGFRSVFGKNWSTSKYKTLSALQMAREIWIEGDDGQLRSKLIDVLMDNGASSVSEK